MQWKICRKDGRFSGGERQANERHETATGQTGMKERIPLTDLKNGETATIAEVLGGCGIKNRLRALGIMPGVKVKRVSGTFSHGPLVLHVCGSQTALGFGICCKVIVEAER